MQVIFPLPNRGHETEVQSIVDMSGMFGSDVDLDIHCGYIRNNGMVMEHRGYEYTLTNSACLIVTLNSGDEYLATREGARNALSRRGQEPVVELERTP